VPLPELRPAVHRPRLGGRGWAAAFLREWERAGYENVQRLGPALNMDHAAHQCGPLGPEPAVFEMGRYEMGDFDFTIKGTGEVQLIEIHAIFRPRPEEQFSAYLHCGHGCAPDRGDCAVTLGLNMPAPEFALNCFRREPGYDVVVGRDERGILDIGLRFRQGALEVVMTVFLMAPDMD
jgi:hypothetical protein